jgi:drug/metabolite transporter (DMT)-like permease
MEHSPGPGAMTWRGQAPGSATARPTDLKGAAALMIVAAGLFALMGMAVQIASMELPSPLVVFFRNAFGLLVLVAWFPGIRSAGLKTRRGWGHLVRSLSGLAAMYCFFLAMAHMRLADAICLNYSMPLFLPFIERVWLRERMRRAASVSIILGFAGVMLIVKPGTTVFQPLAVVGILAAVFAAVAQVGVRRLTTTEPPTRIVFYFGLMGTIVAALPLPTVWKPPTPVTWAVLLGIGCLATLAQMAMTHAFGKAPAAQVGPFIYAAVPIAALLDYLRLGRIPDTLSLVGAFLIVGAGIWMVRMGSGPRG